MKTIHQSEIYLNQPSMASSVHPSVHITIRSAACTHRSAAISHLIVETSGYLFHQFWEVTALGTEINAGNARPDLLGYLSQCCQFGYFSGNPSFPLLSFMLLRELLVFTIRRGQGEAD